MANEMMPYSKETGVSTFPDVEKWKSFGLNKTFSEKETPGFEQGSAPAVNFKLSAHQLGHSEGPLLDGKEQNKSL